MKKTTAVILTLVLLALCTLSPFQYAPAKAADVSIWHGAVDTSWYRNTSAREYRIRTAEELAGLANIVNGGESFEGKTIYLEKDIVLNEGDATTWSKTAPGNAWTPIGANGKAFRGIFDGKGHTVSGMYISYTKESGSNDDQQGFFGVVSQTNGSVAAPSVRNVSVVNSYIHNTCAEKVGMLVGQIYVAKSVNATEVRIENIHVQGTISNNYKNARIGGVCSMMNLQTPASSKALFRNVVSDVDISSTSTRMLAGIVSCNTAATKYAASTDVFENCVNLGDLISDWNGCTVGGLYGNTSSHANVVIKNCVNAGKLKGQKVGAAIGSVSMNVKSKLTVDHFINTGKVDYVSANYKSAGAIYGGGKINSVVEGTFNQCYSVPVQNLEGAMQYEKSVLTGEGVLATLASNEFETSGWILIPKVAPIPKISAVVCDYAEYSGNRLAAVQNTKANNGLMTVRLIGGIDSLNYKKVGFKVTINEAAETDMDTKTVSTVIAYDGEKGTQKMDAYTGFLTPYVYFGELGNISATAKVTITVIPFKVDLKGNRTDGEEYTIVYEAGVLKKATASRGGLILKDDNASGYNKPVSAD